jgi:hypothetical protein
MGEVVRFPKYEILFQRGKSPTVIYVQPARNKLYFELAGRTYAGGDSAEFKRRIEAIIAASSTN